MKHAHELSQLPRNIKGFRGVDENSKECKELAKGEK